MTDHRRRPRSDLSVVLRRTISRVRRAAFRRRQALRERVGASVRLTVVDAPGGGGDDLVLASALPPVTRVVRPRIRAAVAAGPRLRAGLSHEWTQLDLVAGAPWPGSGEQAPSLLLVELGDPGPGTGWLAPVGAAGQAGPLLDRALDEAGRAAVPTVAWVTVPGAAASRFVEVAGRFDHVLLLDADLVPPWAQRLGRERVWHAGAAAQPRIHSPLVPAGEARRPGHAYLHLEEPVDADADVRASVEDVCARSARLRLQVWRTEDGSAGEPLLGPRGSRRFAGSLPYARLAHVPPRYRVAMDVAGPDRSVRWRVVEAGACATPVVRLGPPSTVDGLGSAVVCTEDPATFVRHVSARLQHPVLRDRDGLRLRRAVLDAHTFGHRVDALLSRLELPASGTETPTVSAVVPTNRPDELDNVFVNVARQSHERLELVLVAHGLDLDVDEVEARARDLGVGDLTLVQVPATDTLGTCMNRGIEASSGRYIAKIDDDNYYGTHYVRDLVRAFDHTDAGVVGKWAHYVWLRSDDAVVLRYADSEHRYTRLVQGGTMLIDGDLARRLRFSDIPRAVDTDFLTRAAEREHASVYSADRFNFVSIRAASPGGHTWKVTDLDILTGSADLCFYGDPRPQVEA